MPIELDMIQNRDMRFNRARFRVPWRADRPLLLAATLIGVLVSSHAPAAIGAPAKRPNILVIMTDDQGYGDLGAHGNTKIKTPHLDRFVTDSVRLKNFYVSPVCAPTRASLLTGRYHFRTGVVDTYLGRAMMHPDEVTLAEILAGSNYRTGIFGKWHLGDNAPLRPIDQGFSESLVIKGGGLGQPANPPGGDSYTDPILEHNGHALRYQGYCSDVFTSAAIDFLAERQKRPAFLRVPGFQLPARTIRGTRGRARPLPRNEFGARFVSPAGAADPQGMGRIP